MYKGLFVVRSNERDDGVVRGYDEKGFACGEWE
jgi:hypothetical protein